jgi:hypothetical protein
MNKIFLVFSSAVIITTIITYIKNKYKNTNIVSIIKISILSMIGLTLFYILAYTKSGYYFASRTESVFGVYFYLILILIFSMLYIIKCYPKVYIILPLIIAMLFLETTRANMPFSNGNYTDTVPSERYELMNDWINQIVAADKSGKTTVEIKYNVGIWESDSFAKALFSHNITTKIMDIKFVMK